MELGLSKVGFLVLPHVWSVSRSASAIKHSTRLGEVPYVFYNHYTMSSPDLSHYSELEAAETLGVTVEELRSLVQRYINPGEEVSATATYSRSDIIVLRVLASKAPALIS
jgi:hypothetical protein